MSTGELYSHWFSQFFVVATNVRLVVTYQPQNIKFLSFLLIFLCPFILELFPNSAEENSVLDL